MGKKTAMIAAISMAILLALPAYAEVQNIKISGDATVRSLFRDNYDLDADNDDSHPDNYFMHSLGLNVLADLTDNVGATVRLVSQRDWDNSNNSTTGTSDEEFDVDLDLAYATLKEVIYAPLTLQIGRQDIWLGNGFIVGAKLLDFNSTISANEYTETAAFDAIRATLDYNPITLDLIYSKVDENTTTTTDDVDLYVINAGYRQDAYNAIIEAYVVTKIDDGPQLQEFPANANETDTQTNKVYTYGSRVNLDPRDNLNLAGEVALQYGDYSQVANTATTVRSRRAYALDLMGEYRFPQNQWKPKLALEYIVYSGEQNTADADTGDWNAWDAVYRGKFDTAIREFQNYYYETVDRCDGNGDTTEVDMDSGLTNQRQLLLKGTIYPLKQLTVEGTLACFWLDQRAKTGQDTKDIGNELDLLLTYDYSEDLSFNLLAAYFMPGSYWTDDQNDKALDVVGSMKLTF